MVTIFGVVGKRLIYISLLDDLQSLSLIIVFRVHFNDVFNFGLYSLLHFFDHI